MTDLDIVRELHGAADRAGLVLRKPGNNHQQMLVTIFRDPEGNGPGFLDIRKEKYGK